MLNKKYRLITANTNYWIFITDFRNCRIKWSISIGEELFGLNFSKVLGKSCCELIHGRDQPLIKCPKKIFKKNDTKKTIEFRHGKKKQIFLETIIPIFNEIGEIEYIIHIIFPLNDKSSNVRPGSQIDRMKKTIIIKTLLLAQMIEKLFKIKSQLSSIEKTNGNNKILRKINQEIAEAINSDNIWEEFALRFENIHIGFYQYLLDQSLTPGQIRICAFLYLNLNTKEIASLLSISPRSVEQMRYRIRKKLSIKKGESLTSFLLSSYPNRKKSKMD